MSQNLNPNVKTSRQLNSTAAGTSVVNGVHVDMQDFDGVVFICALGALTATQVTALKAQEGSQSNDSDQADIAGAVTPAAADADSNKVLILDVYRPLQRYVRPVVLRGTANAAIDGVIAIRYRGNRQPIQVQDATVSQQLTVVGS